MHTLRMMRLFLVCVMQKKENISSQMKHQEVYRCEHNNNNNVMANSESIIIDPYLHMYAYCAANDGADRNVVVISAVRMDDAYVWR